MLSQLVIATPQDFIILTIRGWFINHRMPVFSICLRWLGWDTLALYFTN